ncbi:MULTISPECIES: ABC exporter membrane fusion protein [Nostoc]|jgi:HlyD family secretion protein|uniref:ABC exporter membrane fusion protein n=1 Tax=Nostoc punctiforme FACHB-252 TaxID=1357509 RepID=A0ABR8HDS4_NOSPU|nr:MULTISPECIES: ABC exporter membrane fusion protein [Nostoc]MBC1237279.1 ABC exporter membrane fusion protein [Nostoc sp. 2RC]MBD2613454.1 ABC exporter membrane fusion protein [Nostoc punctiforme FACHB-252]MBL1198718.1 HlyD family efflux transporter periplasmic adaptor subunit [Nostoc sp. GBBB01]MDZ8013967.1 ABC exporter membrane fusion protein [Nostoc sp. ZfuVER08]
MIPKQKESFIKPFIKPISWSSAMLAGIMAVATVGVSLYTFSKFQLFSKEEPVVTSSSPPKMTAVSALGRLEPQGEVIRLSAPESQAGVRVTKLLVNKGDRVQEGQIVALLDTYFPRLAALEKAQQQVVVAQASLNQVKAGAKAGDISAQQATIARLEAELEGETSAQQATIARLEAELRNAESENQRYQKLYKDGAISASDADAKRLRLDTVQQQLNEAKASLRRTIETLQKQLIEARARLKSIAEVRPTDIAAAQADVESAIASVKQAQAEWDLSVVRSPITGQIMKINTWPGEIIGTTGIADIGRTQQMYVVAEVYETDIQKVRLGQSAIISSDVFPGTLRGKVADIGLQVGKQNIFNNAIQADTDNKIVDVKIRIDNPEDNQKAAGLSDLQVEVMIYL